MSRVTPHAVDPGFTLADRLAHPAPMTPVEVAVVGAQVASELHGWHRGGVSHRALGPDHVVITAGPEGRLLARLRPPVEPVVAAASKPESVAASEPASDPVIAAAPAGDARYRAPEQLSGRPVGPAADVYALGVVLLDGLVGRCDGPPEVPEGLGSAWRYLLTGMVATSPADRPTAETVAHTLEQVPGVSVPAASAASAPAAPSAVVEAPVRAAPRSKLLPGGAHVEPVPIELPRESRLSRLLPTVPGRRRPPEPDVRQHPEA